MPENFRITHERYAGVEGPSRMSFWVEPPTMQQKDVIKLNGQEVPLEFPTHYESAEYSRDNLWTESGIDKLTPKGQQVVKALAEIPGLEIIFVRCGSFDLLFDEGNDDLIKQARSVIESKS